MMKSFLGTVFGVLAVLVPIGGTTNAQDAPSAPQYNMTEIRGAVLPVFKDWSTQPIQAEQNTHDIVMAPKSQGDSTFAVRVILAFPNSRFMKDLEGEGHQFVTKLLQGFEAVGEPNRFTLEDGSKVMAEEFKGQIKGTTVLVLAAYAQKRNGGIILLGMGSESSFKEYGGAMGVLLAKTSFQGGVAGKVEKGAIDPVLVGTWVWEMSSGGDYPVSSKISVTINPDGSYTYYAITITSHSDAAPSETYDGGTVVLEGNVLVFKSQSGQTTRTPIQMQGTNMLYAGGRGFIKQ